MSQALVETQLNNFGVTSSFLSDCPTKEFKQYFSSWTLEQCELVRTQVAALLENAKLEPEMTPIQQTPNRAKSNQHMDVDSSHKSESKKSAKKDKSKKKKRKKKKKVSPKTWDHATSEEDSDKDSVHSSDPSMPRHFVLELSPWDSSEDEKKWKKEKKKKKRKRKRSKKDKENGIYDSDWSESAYQVRLEGMSTPDLRQERELVSECLRDEEEELGKEKEKETPVEEEHSDMHNLSMPEIIRELKILIGEGDATETAQNLLYQGEEDPGKVYCLCRRPYDADQSMICCDFCEEWYHLQCVGLTEAELNKVASTKYKCPECRALETGEPLEQLRGNKESKTKVYIAKDSNVQKLKTENEKLKQKAAHIKKRAKKREKKFREAQQRWMQELGGKDEQISKMESKLSLSQSRLIELEREGERHLNIARELETVEKKLEKADKAKAKYKRMADKERKNAEGLSGTVELLNNKIEELEGNMATGQQEYVQRVKYEQQMQIFQIQKELEQCQKEMQNEQMNARKAEAKTQDLMNNMQRVSQQWQSAIQEKDQKIKELQSALNQMQMGMQFSQGQMQGQMVNGNMLPSNRVKTPEPPIYPNHVPRTPPHLKFTEDDMDKLAFFRALTSWIYKSQPAYGTQAQLAGLLGIPEPLFVRWVDQGDCKFIIKKADGHFNDGSAITLEQIEQKMNELEKWFQNQYETLHKHVQSGQTNCIPTCNLMKQAVQMFEQGRNQHFRRVYNRKKSELFNNIKEGCVVQINMDQIGKEPVPHADISVMLFNGKGKVLQIFDRIPSPQQPSRRKYASIQFDGTVHNLNALASDKIEVLVDPQIIRVSRSSDSSRSSSLFNGGRFSGVPNVSGVTNVNPFQSQGVNPPVVPPYVQQQYFPANVPTPFPTVVPQPTFAMATHPTGTQNGQNSHHPSRSPSASSNHSVHVEEVQTPRSSRRGRAPKENGRSKSKSKSNSRRGRGKSRAKSKTKTPRARGKSKSAQKRAKKRNLSPASKLEGTKPAKRQRTSRNDMYETKDGSKDENDSTCRVCQQGGELLCCEGCPAAFHHKCLRPQVTKKWTDLFDDWYCPQCAPTKFHVPLWNPRTGEKLAQAEEPLYKDLKDYLQEHPQWVRDMNPDYHHSRTNVS